jgi:hypothetical protein
MTNPSNSYALGLRPPAERPCSLHHRKDSDSHHRVPAPCHHPGQTLRTGARSVLMSAWHYHLTSPGHGRKRLPPNVHPLLSAALRLKHGRDCGSTSVSPGPLLRPRTLRNAKAEDPTPPAQLVKLDSSHFGIRLIPMQAKASTSVLSPSIGTIHHGVECCVNLQAGARVPTSGTPPGVRDPTLPTRVQARERRPRLFPSSTWTPPEVARVRDSDTS